MIFQVGTAVVTRGDGRLALGRLGALCEQVCEINYVGVQVSVCLSIHCIVGVEEYKKLVPASFSIFELVYIYIKTVTLMTCFDCHTCSLKI